MPDQVLEVPASGRLLIDCPGSNNATKVYLRTRLVNATYAQKPCWAGLIHGPISATPPDRYLGGERKKFVHPGFQLIYSDWPYWVNGGYPGAVTTRKNVLMVDMNPRYYSHLAVWFALSGSLSTSQGDIAIWM